jgi:histidinol-phosphate/aromatic aminotransferase/cobyric acid decarboxylase-like protein
MFETPPAADSEIPDPATARAERRLRLLAELSKIGMELTRAPTPNATASGEAAGDTAKAFARLSRAIRLTQAMEARTDEALRISRAYRRELRRFGLHAGTSSEAFRRSQFAGRRRVH